VYILDPTKQPCGGGGTEETGIEAKQLEKCKKDKNRDKRTRLKKIRI